MRAVLLTVVRGFSMGAADVVPGVSGGTVALVLRIYPHLVETIRNGSSAVGHLLKADVKGFAAGMRAVDWKFLVPLLLGIGLAVVSLAGIIEHQLEENPEEMAGLFSGLVLGSVVVAWGLLTIRDARRMAVLLGVAVLVFLLMGLTSGTSEDSVSQVAQPALWAFFLSGAVAICAMILPGISGSFILVMLGMYGAVLGTVTDRDLLSLVVFLSGCVIGLGLFSQVLHWALSTHYDTVMAALIGLILGSLRVLWPWPAGLDSTELGAPAAGEWLVPTLMFVAGLALVLGIEALSRALGGPDTEEELEEIHAV